MGLLKGKEILNKIPIEKLVNKRVRNGSGKGANFQSTSNFEQYTFSTHKF